MKTENEEIRNEAETADENPADALAELKSENEVLRRQLAAGKVRKTLTEAFRDAGAVSPELIFRAVESEVQLDEHGAVLNTAALVEKLKRDFPAEFRVFQPALPGIDGGAGRSGQPNLTKEALAKMTSTQIAALDWADVRRVLSGE